MAAPAAEIKVTTIPICSVCQKDLGQHILEFDGAVYHPECFKCAGPCKVRLAGPPPVCVAARLNPGQ